MLALGPINRGSDPSDGPPRPSPGASSFLAFRACHSPFSELGRHDGRGGRKLASKARRRRALTVVYPPRNKSPLTTSLLSNWPSTQSEGWRSGSICPLLEHRLTLRLVVLSAGVDPHALVAGGRGNEPDASRFVSVGSSVSYSTTATTASPHSRQPAEFGARWSDLPPGNVPAVLLAHENRRLSIATPCEPTSRRGLLHTKYYMQSRLASAVRSIAHG